MIGAGELDHAGDADRQRSRELVAHRGEAAALQHLVDAVAGAASRGGDGWGSTRGRRRTRRLRRATPAPRARCPPRRATRTPARAGRCGAGRCGRAAWPTATSRRCRRGRRCRSLGARTPEITSKSVVLPAPLGPMRPSTSPGATSRSTSLSAEMPPKRTEMPSRWRMVEPPDAAPSPRPSTCTCAVKPVPLDRVGFPAGGS